ncbi:MAG: hypothetical protein JWN59_1304 [Sphingomonas bacterium]|nr:hypothetical protein [Sphingomonas bacterium]
MTATISPMRNLGASAARVTRYNPTPFPAPARNPRNEKF